MKITTWVTINQKPVGELSKSIRLDLTTPGRGIISVTSDQPVIPGQYIQISMQLGDNPAQVVFQGVVHNVTPMQKGAYKVVIREFSALLNQRISINLRHCTAENILSYISEKTGLVFVLPDSEWTKQDIARFQHVGGGYGALDNLLRVFQVKQGIWQQQPDGRIYVGELDKSIMQGKAVSLRPEIITNLSNTGGNIPAIPRLRPGARIRLNDHRKIITDVEINDNMMRLTWADNISNKHMQAIQ